MSREVDRALDARGGRVPGSPWMLVGFGAGLLALLPGVVPYYWLFAPAAPLLLGGLLTLLSTWKPRLMPVAEGAFAAGLFGVVAAVAMFIGLDVEPG